ncbi:hypothetical protein ACA30_10630 [Virgibacillus soli]|nr:hypothetical protein ACA30_10630 [Virgibacillus soli]
MEHKRHFGRPLPLTYFLRSYGISLLLTGGFLILFYFTGDLEEYILLFVLMGVLFPFAKIPFDLLIGFKIMDKIKHSQALSYLDYQFQFLFSLLFYIFSVFLAPLGIIYQIITYSYQAIKRKHST